MEIPYVYEIKGIINEIFYFYISAFSKDKLNELKFILIDNVRFHSLSNYNIPDSIKFIRILADSSELNHSEKSGCRSKDSIKTRCLRTLTM